MPLPDRPICGFRVTPIAAKLRTLLGPSVLALQEARVFVNTQTRCAHLIHAGYPSAQSVPIGEIRRTSFCDAGGISRLAPEEAPTAATGPAIASGRCRRFMVSGFPRARRRPFYLRANPCLTGDRISDTTLLVSRRQYLLSNSLSLSTFLGPVNMRERERKREKERGREREREGRERERKEICQREREGREREEM